jgi:hypothetical protein
MSFEFPLSQEYLNKSQIGLVVTHGSVRKVKPRPNVASHPSQDDFLRVACFDSFSDPHDLQASVPHGEPDGVERRYRSYLSAVFVS